MSNGTPLPATAFSTYTGPNIAASALWVNGQNYFPDLQSNNESAIWLVVVSLSDLSVVAQDVSDGQSVPDDVASYAGNPGYFLYAISNAAWASQMPQGDLYNLLTAVGAGPKLARLEQIYETIGTGVLGAFSYILAATMTENDEAGFEELSMDNATVLTMGFLKLDVNNETVYVPVQAAGG